MPAATLYLQRDGLQWIGLRAGREIRCLQGRLWLTFDRCLPDVVLDAGDAFLSPDDGPALVQALKPAQFQVL